MRNFIAELVDYIYENFLITEKEKEERERRIELEKSCAKLIDKCEKLGRSSKRLRRQKKCPCPNKNETPICTRTR